MNHNSEDHKSTDGLVTKKFVIKNKLGLHARPAALFVEAASRYKSDIYIRKGSRRVNGKSIMGLMMLAAGCGSKITVEVEGADAHEAIEGLGKIITNNFNE
ncbi:MAG: HPr family phosphocarrier protein [Candidatus Omnitrophica bacterium]|nr:HPr family phosphocarrier protein [Candidatus Omnitrophota bacterium]